MVMMIVVMMMTKDFPTKSSKIEIEISKSRRKKKAVDLILLRCTTFDHL